MSVHRTDTALHGMSRSKHPANCSTIYMTTRNGLLGTRTITTIPATNEGLVQQSYHQPRGRPFGPGRVDTKERPSSEDNSSLSPNCRISQNPSVHYRVHNRTPILLILNQFYPFSVFTFLFLEDPQSK